MPSLLFLEIDMCRMTFEDVSPYPYVFAPWCGVAMTVVNREQRVHLMQKNSSQVCNEM
ncbi:protein of unknown function [Pseudodesulfovibrio piezophilus C1TLV30]|uniref:Uncharacterized protein n=1 Tax=Pseudodesulfovibrio piezophilus (strain DSM 21447 / JCM 15486 / C1TLV30) TaxID=1322246 RepID=M1WSL8_PSEP2|nr:protein of unknown function [Pseudodesulfovibrio piezophilus C1TLV30]